MCAGIPIQALPALVRLIAVCKSRADVLRKRDPIEAEPLDAAARLASSMIAALIKNAIQLIVVPPDSYHEWRSVPDHRDVVNCLLRDKGGQAAMAMAIDFECLELVQTLDIRRFLEALARAHSRHASIALP